MKKPIRALIACLILLATVATSPAQAHTISIFQLIQTILIGNPFLITLVADFSGTPRQFNEPEFRASVSDPEIVVDEIGIAISWDPAVIDVIWTNILNPPWDSTVIRPDNDGLTTLFLKSSAGTESELFAVASMGFVARGVGTTDVIIDTTSGYCTTMDCGVFYDGVEIPTEFINGKVTVVEPSQVPVPGGLWLFVSGLLAMAGFIRRRRTSGL